MKIVIDSNRLIAALIKEGTTREILLDKNFEFFAPEHIKDEISSHKYEIILKSGLNEEEFEILVQLMFDFIKIIPKGDYSQFVDELKTEIKDIDDIPYLAVCWLIDADGIWTHDPHFFNQNKFKIMTNIDMLNISDRNNFELE